MTWCVLCKNLEFHSILDIAYYVHEVAGFVVLGLDEEGMVIAHSAGKHDFVDVVRHFWFNFGFIEKRGDGIDYYGFEE